MAIYALADALIAAFAADVGAVLVHKDPELRVLAGVVEMEELPPESGSPE